MVDEKGKQKLLGFTQIFHQSYKHVLMKMKIQNMNHVFAYFVRCTIYD